MLVMRKAQLRRISDRLRHLVGAHLGATATCTVPSCEACRAQGALLQSLRYGIEVAAGGGSEGLVSPQQWSRRNPVGAHSCATATCMAPSCEACRAQVRSHRIIAARRKQRMLAMRKAQLCRSS